MKSTQTYWNTLDKQYAGEWKITPGSDGSLSQLTIADGDVVILEMSYPSQSVTEEN
ncbi:MAG: hypothetical protein RPU42_03260 [Candidatus Sedimenticola sp. (ex Thyasira tokunagai)]